MNIKHKRKQWFPLMVAGAFIAIPGLDSMTTNPAVGQDARNVQEALQPPQDTAPGEANRQKESQEDFSVLTRGALHEAFASVYSANPEPGMRVSKEPPQAIDEVPPEYKPDGQNIEWIPGYWAWDDDQDDFVWTSGVWRDIPPKQQWVPGYWESFENGWRRVSGFWIGGEVDEVSYLPAPPEAVENGPSSPAPDDQHFYVPGNWVYASNDYQWRAGYWAPAHEHWVWVPSQYIWTPRGCVYVAGYWDYEIHNRGVVFAPVHFHRPVYRQEGYHYSPYYTIDADVNLLVHLFHRPHHNHYYFGDYYGERYEQHYHPWAGTHTERTWYDPLYTYYNVKFQGRNNNVVQWVNQRHNYYVEHEQYRPARTLQGQIDLYQAAQTENIDPSVIRLSTFGESITDLVKGNRSNYRFTQMNQNEQGQLRERTRPYRAISEARNRIETVLDRTENRAAENVDRVRDRVEDQVDQVQDQVRDQVQDRVKGTRQRTGTRADRSPDQAEVLRLLNLRQKGTVQQDRLNEIQDQVRDAREDLREQRNDITDRIGGNNENRERKNDLQQSSRQGQELARQEQLRQNRANQQLRDEAMRKMDDQLRQRPERPDNWPGRQRVDRTEQVIPKRPVQDQLPNQGNAQNENLKQPPQQRGNQNREKGNQNKKGGKNRDK